MNAARASLPSLLLILAAATPFAGAADYAPAPDDYRQEFVRTHMTACIDSIEGQPDLRVLYSHEVVVKLCTCRKQFLADVVYDAIAKDRRDVHNEATDYSVNQCPVNRDGSVGLVHSK
jgi:hypothetical protein